MTLKAFLFLFAVTMVAVVGSALIAEMLVGPGLERGIIIAVLSGLVVFPAARWAEYRGWIKGSWSPGGERRTAHEAHKAKEAEEARAGMLLQSAPETQEAAGADRPVNKARGDQESRADENFNNQTAAARDHADPRAGDHPMRGDPR